MMRALLLCAFTIATLSTEPPGASAIQSATPNVAPVAAGTDTENADEPWLAWMNGVTAALNEKDHTAFDRLVSADAILDRALEDVPGRKSFLSGFRAGARSTMSGGKGLYAEMRAILEQGGHVDFLRLRGTPGARTALFRLVIPAAGFDYLEFDLEREEKKSVRAVDVYSASAGEHTSALLRRWLLPLAANDDRTVIERLIGTEQTLIQHWSQVERLIQASQSRDADAFSKTFAELPSELRQDKLLILMRIRMFPPDDERYLQAIGDLRTFYPDDACTRMHSIDWFFLHHEHEKCLRELRILDAWAGGDPYTSYVRAQYEVGAERWDEARAAANEAIDGGIDWVEPYWILVTASLHQKRPAETLALLLRMDEAFVLEWADFTTLELYSGFVASPLHAEWLVHLSEKAETR